MNKAPCVNEIIKIVDDLRCYIFKEQFVCQSVSIEDIKERLLNQIELAIKFTNSDLNAKEINESFFNDLDDISKKLHYDALAGFNGDPAATSVDEVILTYPGMFAIFVHRIAHYLYSTGLRLLPRMIQEYAHSKTGIDINPGATIGNNFFIDHGTGVVIGETTVIGNNVKIYQGVTLGALSTAKGQLLKNKKRHPTIEDNVVIYANATILGGDTVIGENSIIGGNSFVLESIGKNQKVINEYKIIKANK